MSKIPVGATIAHAYRFAIGGFPRVLSIVWLPWLILTAGGFLLRSSTVAFSTALATGDFGGISHLLIGLVPFYILTVILLFMQIAGITQQALGVRTGSRYYYFSLGKPMWRLLAAFLLTTLIALGSYILLLSAGLLLGVVVAILAKVINFSSATRGILGIGAAIAIIAVFCAYVYALARMTFFLNPVVIAEHQISLKRSWSLGRGNFWRIVIVLIAVLAPVFMLQASLMLSLLTHGLPPIQPPHATADQIAMHRALVAAWNAAMIKRSADYWFIVYPAYGLAAALFYGLTCGAQSFSYRAITSEMTAASANPL